MTSPEQKTWDTILGNKTTIDFSTQDFKLPKIELKMTKEEFIITMGDGLGAQARSWILGENTFPFKKLTGEQIAELVDLYTAFISILKNRTPPIEYRILDL